MKRPSISWTGTAIVNGVLAIVLLAWLADGQTRQPIPDRAAAPPPAERADTQTSVTPVEAAAPINLPPPPRPAVAEQAAVPRPVTPIESSPRVEIEPLRAANPEPSPPPVKVEPMRVAKAEKPPPTPVAAQPPRPVVKPMVPVRKVIERTAPSEPPPAVKVDAKAMRTGRALLRIFEHGNGPGIEIAWPDTSADRERLHGVFRRCFGMRLALIDGAGALYLDDGPPGRAWPIDLDRYSGFVRRPNGRLTAAERRDAARIARYHRGLPAGAPVRVFPRAADAVLLGGFDRLLGEGYRTSSAITASYRLRRGRVTVGGIRIDGRGVAGEIDLSPAASAACRARAGL